MADATEETRLYPPLKEFVDQAYVKSRDEYEKMWKQSIQDPETFWGGIAKELHWFKPWLKVNREDFAKGEVEWFIGGKTNIAYNCLDAQVEKGKGDKVAILFQGEPEDDVVKLTYKEMLSMVSKFANVLKKKGVRKGDRIAIYLPMIWQLPVVMLACARIGAVHTIVFGGFSAEALRDRILDAGAKMLITTNGYWRSGKTVSSKANADKACDLCLEQGHTVDKVVVVKRLDNFDVPMKAGRDTWFEEELAAADITDACPAEMMDAEDPLFILYTSGSTGKPKGVLHTVGGYMVYVYSTFKYIFDYKDKDVFFCTADIGWVTGHSYIVYGPMCNGATSIVSSPSRPSRTRQVLADRREIQGQHLLHRPDSHQGPHERRREVAAGQEPLLPETPRFSRRADQPRGVAVVPQVYRRREMPHRRHLVADGDRRHPHHLSSWRVAGKAGLRDASILRR